MIPLLPHTAAYDALKMKILIIDDEIDLCLLMKSYFVKKGHEVYVCHTLKDGLEKIEIIEPNTIYLDNNLPDGIGWELAPAIAGAHPDTFINLLSAFHPNPPAMPNNAKYRQLEKPVSLMDLEA